MGAKVRLAAPFTMLPLDTNSLGVESFTSLDEALSGTDVIMALRIQTERIKEEMFPSVYEYVSTFSINRSKLELANRDAILLHPGPVNWGVELSPDLVDHSANMILKQVRNGVAIRMAALYLCTGG
jgi:aspartate carbamoyltransferase catalytic subunit